MAKNPTGRKVDQKAIYTSVTAKHRTRIRDLRVASQRSKPLGHAAFLTATPLRY